MIFMKFEAMSGKKNRLRRGRSDGLSSGGEEKTFKCDICNKFLKGQLNRHLLMHKTDVEHTCDVCKKTLNSSDLLTDHLKKHTAERPYHCELCNKRFKRGSNLQEHLKIHAVHRQFRCDKCGMLFSRSSDLARHVHRHSVEKIYNCSECTMSFNDKAYLQQHVSRLHKKKMGKFVCTICQQSFEHSSYLIRHGRVHSEERSFPCDVCDKSFRSKDNLAQHRRTHTGEKPHKCDVCGKAFSAVSNLSQHMKIHTGEMPYNCQICNKAFSRSNHLQRHMRIHSGLKPHQCPVCNKSFNDKSNLRLHLKRIHPGYDVTVITESSNEALEPFQETRTEEQFSYQQRTNLNNSFIVGNSLFRNSSVLAVRSTTERKSIFGKIQSSTDDSNSSTDSNGIFGFAALCQQHKEQLSNVQDKSGKQPNAFGKDSSTKSFNTTVNEKMNLPPKKCVPKKTRGKKYLKQSYSTDHDKNKAKAKMCKICSLQFSTEKESIEHMRIHRRKQYTPVKRHLDTP